MFKPRLALLGVLALFITSGIVTSAASAEGPYWRVNGSRLEQGKKQVKISAVQVSPELKGKVNLLEAWISCKTAVTQNAYIEGNGTNQGQDSASSITFSGCSTFAPPKCIVNEPIKTSQLKSHLVTFTNNEGQTKIGDLFEPSQPEAPYVELSFKAGAEPCSLGTEKFPVKGKVVAEVFPENQEAQAGYLIFPAEPIKKVKHEGQEVTVELAIGANKGAKFGGIFEAQLAPVERFGAFLT